MAGCFRPPPAPEGAAGEDASTLSVEMFDRRTLPCVSHIAVKEPEPDVSSAMLLIGQVGTRHWSSTFDSNVCPSSFDSSNVTSRSTPPLAARYSTPRRPRGSANAFKPQHPHAPVAVGLIFRSSVNVFPSSADFAM